MFYGANVWDPWLILAQIVTVQCLFYLSFGLLLYVFLGPYVNHLALSHFFVASSINLYSFAGWMITATNLLNSLSVALSLMFVVERAKKCLDFAATCYVLHLAIVSMVGGFPRTPTWWVVNGTAMAIAALLGEWLCVRRELQDIPMGGVARRWSGASEAFKSPTSVAALTGALFGRSSRSGTGGVQLATNRSLRGTPEDQAAAPAQLPSG
ncbi:g4551 [Coccomyxa viridis]|uniref:G4551 protein n=1 Tax=Coccomyxa viridis TaxID=1274662 RepID=A0ABP1FQL3_9CHLO